MYNLIHFFNASKKIYKYSGCLFADTLYTGQQQGIGNLAAAGQLQQDTTQNVADSNRNEFLRLQGLGEASGTGMLGGFSPVTTTTSQSSK
jgi:hypothetical protein